MKVRISIANLATRLRMGENGAKFIFGIVNKTALKKEGIRVACALGGAAHMTEFGKKFLERRYSAEFFDGPDARFLMPAERQDEVIKMFEQREEWLYKSGEEELLREAREELSTREIPEIQTRPILTKIEILLVRATFLKTVTLLKSERRLARDVDDVPTIRIFNIFELIVDPGVGAIILKSPIIYTFSEAQLEVMKAGQEVRAGDRTLMGGNLF